MPEIPRPQAEQQRPQTSPRGRVSRSISKILACKRRHLVKRLTQLLLAWLLLSLALFLISAQVHKTRIKDGLSGGSYPLTSATNVLVLGSDARPKGRGEPGSGGPSRSDSIMLLRVGGGANARLSIPRDMLAEIPGHGVEKINAAYAYGGPGLAARTVERFLGLAVNHVVDITFANFPPLIDAMGGISYRGSCVVSRINGGARNGGYTLRLKAGKTHIDGNQALALARTRKNLCNRSENDLARARRQQKLIGAMRTRLISPGALIRLPWIAWQAPQALRSDMGGPTLLGLFAGLMIGGGAKTRVLTPTGQVVTASGQQALTLDETAKRRAVRAFLAG